MTLLLKYGTKKKENEETSLGRMVDAHKINKTNGSMQIARRTYERFTGVVGIVIVVFAGAAVAVAVVMSDK